MRATHSYAVLVDAGFLKKKLGTTADPVNFSAVDDFLTRLEKSPELKGCSLYRIYFYDAEPLRSQKAKPLNGGVYDFGATPVAQTNEDLHTKLRERPFVALRLGELVFRGWRVRQWKLQQARADELRITAADLEANLNQKGVDMRVGLDIAALALKRIVDVVVLITGDTDFIPAMKFARREGLQLYLVSIGDRPHVGLREHSDLVINIPRPKAAAAGKHALPIKAPPQ